MLIKNAIILLITAYMWIVVIYIVCDFFYKMLGKQGMFVETIRKAAYDFCKPIFTGVKFILPPKFSEFTPFVAFLFVRTVLFILSTIKF